MPELAEYVDVGALKIAYSASFNTQLDWVLRRAGIDTLAICGIVTNGGVASTGRDAHMRDYRVIVLADGCAASTPAAHDAALADLHTVGRRAQLRSLRQPVAVMSAPLVRRGLPPGSDLPHLSVAIVGAGECGLTAALGLQDAGVDCMLLERDARPSGSTALSSDFIPAAASTVQRSAGIDDSVERFAADILAKTSDTAARHLVLAYTEASGAALDMPARPGFEFEILDGFLYPGHTARRMHSLSERTGAALMSALERAVAATDATLITRTLVRELRVDDDGRIVAVGGERPDGSMEYLLCDAVLLACNGFGGNAALREALLPEVAGAVYGGHKGNDGSALAWGRQLGAGEADLGG